MRQIEKALGGPGSLDIPTPGFPYLTLRKRVAIRLQRGDGVPFCKVCRKPYIIDAPRRNPTCKGRCASVYRERQRALEEGLKKYAGQYDPRVDVRLWLGLPIKTCRQCGIPFPDYHPRRVYCSKQCNRNAWYARHPKHQCVVCGDVFRGTQKTCSVRCRKMDDYHHKTHCVRCARVIKPGREILPNDDTLMPKHN